MKNKKKKKTHPKGKSGSFAPAKGLVAIKKTVDNTAQLYARNMKSLRQHYPDLARQVEETPENTNYRCFRKSNNQYWNLQEIKSGLLYYHNSEHLQEEIKEQINRLKLKNTRMAVFLGLGLGYELLYYMQHISQQQSTKYILLIEKELEIFKAALKSTDLHLAISHPHVKLVIGEPPEKLYTILRNYMAENNRFYLAKAMKPIYHPSSLAFNKEYYLQTLKELKEAVTGQVLHFGNDPRDSLIGIENMLANLREIVYNPGINLLFNKFKGKPAVVISTGPSLNKNKHLLKGLGEKALLIAADASLKVLLEMGVKPHLVTALERTMGIYKLFEGLKAEDLEDVYFAACPVIDPRVYAAYTGPRMIVYRQFDHFKWLQIDRGMLNIQLSAGNMAFKIAEALGCDPIVLIGQDLAFGRDGTTHANGMALGEKRQLFYDRGTLEVMGNDGQPIMTSRVWYNFLKAYELDVAGYNGTCINSTEGGAYIQGTRVMPFLESIDKYIQENYYPLQIIKEETREFSVANSEDDAKRVKEILSRGINETEQIISFCESAVSLYQEYQQDLQDAMEDDAVLEKIKETLPGIKAQMFEFRQECRKLHETFQLLLFHFIQSFSIKNEMEKVKLPELYEGKRLDIAIIIKMVEWYAVIGDLCKICLVSLKKAYKEID